jgi:outer membrane protein, multidrug efflux system
VRYVSSICITLLITMTSCSVGPPYQSPPVDIPCQWKNSQHTPCTEDYSYLDYWWQVFDDEKLNQLEALALENNKDLLIAFARIQEAEALMGVAAADFYPQLTLNPRFINTVSLTKNQTNLSTTNVTTNNNLLPDTSGGAEGNTAKNDVFRLHQGFNILPLNISYQVDLWGRIKDNYSSYQYNWRARQKDYEFVMLSLTANLAIAYYQARTLDNQLDFLKKAITSFQKSFTINQDRYDEQIINYSDVALAGRELSAAQGDYDEVERQRQLVENQIALLIGAPASEFSLEFSPIQGSPPCIPAGIPSEILLRRPDIASAENTIRAQYSTMKEAYTQFFPSLTLTATPGFESPILKYFLTWMSRYWSNTTAIDQVVFDGFRTYYNLKYQIANFREANVDYQQQVLIAFQEVENALNNLESYAKQYQIAQETTQWAQKSNQLYSNRYQQGIINYIDVASTERDLLNFQINENAIQGLRFISTVQFIQALGGGW